MSASAIWCSPRQTMNAVYFLAPTLRQKRRLARVRAQIRTLEAEEARLVADISQLQHERGEAIGLRIDLE